MIYGLFNDGTRLEAALAALWIGADKYQPVGTAKSLRVGYCKSHFGSYSRQDAG
jgi:hypothetical protein